MDFKRGFLNSKKGRDALATNPQASSSKLAPVDASDISGSSFNTPSPTSSPPVGQKPKLSEKVIPLDLHAAPPGIKNVKPGHTRFVFSEWPRDPNGPFMREEHPEYGKRTSNGCVMWGETLWDFYWVQRMPENKHWMSVTTGSRLADWMRSLGELEPAANLMEWADSEGDPKQIFPCDVGRLIRDRERQAVGADPIERMLLSKAPTLQDRIPFHLLPERVIVHDPWNTLSINGVLDGADASTAEKEDVVHAFDLSLSEEGKQKQVAEREATEAADKALMEKDEWRIILPSVDEPGPVKLGDFAIHAKVPPRPAKPTSIPEAHLHIHREDMCGSGNHSVVYFSELELPRWVFVDDELCETCFQTAVLADLRERLKSGTLFPPNPDRPSGKYKPGEIRRTLEVVEDLRDGVLVLDSGDGPGDSSPQCRIRSTPRKLVKEEYIGPIAYVYPKVSWQNPAYGPVCEHLRIGGLDLPLTTRVRVCSKLSIQGDLHLAREAENYQAFPAYFFEHWNGYNLVYPFRDPVPCGALVPQFYGYYVPRGGFKPVVDDVVMPDPGGTSDSASSSNSAPRLPAGYISPILLLENCGEAIDVDDLNKDERQACAAQYMMFLNGDWTHGSLFDRNIVVQPGPITEWPAFRGMDRRQRSFRLIDFGRAARLAKDGEYINQKEEICKLFKLFQYSVPGP
ncbi:hypothetical protein PENSPDRAFT_621469 [Peniophora sp. CONT]|nr:hypothetical protein PENSPDRAFT_621469 [Peniophora sp. CONT]